MKQTALRHAATVTAVAAAFVLGLAGPAAAHVTVDSSGTATQGGYAKVAFRVPNESDTASTTKLEVNLPADNPLGSVSVRPVPGWTAVAEKTKLATPVKVHDSEISEAVTKITWTAAAGSEIKPGTFQEFDVSLGPLPKTEQMVFKALQTYSDGTIVRWIDEPTTDGTEPENPAPVLALAGAATPSAVASAPAATVAAEESDSGGGAAWGIAGLAAGLAGLVLGLLAYRKAAQAGPSA